MSDNSLFELFDTNQNLENDGVWFDVVGTGTRFLLARAGGANKKYKAAMARARKPYMRRIARGTVDDDTLNTIIKQAFLDGCVLDWDGVRGEDGEVLECTPINKRWLFNRLPDLYEYLAEEAGKVDHYLKTLAEDVGESSPDTATG